LKGGVLWLIGQGNDAEMMDLAVVIAALARRQLA